MLEKFSWHEHFEKVRELVAGSDIYKFNEYTQTELRDFIREIPSHLLDYASECASCGVNVPSKDEEFNYSSFYDYEYSYCDGRSTISNNFRGISFSYERNGEKYFIYFLDEEEFNKLRASDSTRYPLLILEYVNDMDETKNKSVVLSLERKIVSNQYIMNIDVDKDSVHVTTYTFITEQDFNQTVDGVHTV